MKCFVLAALAAALLLTESARAQSDTPANPNPVLLTVNGEDVFVSDVIMLHESLPAQYRQLPMDMLYPQLINRDSPDGSSQSPKKSNTIGIPKAISDPEPSR